MSLLLASGAFRDEDGIPVNLGTAYFGQPDMDPLTNPKTPYADIDLETPVPAVLYLTLSGSLPYDIFLSGNYSLKVFDFNDELVLDYANVSADSPEFYDLSPAGLLGQLRPFSSGTDVIPNGSLRFGNPDMDPATNKKNPVGSPVQPIVLDENGSLPAIVDLGGDEFSMNVYDVDGVLVNYVGRISFQAIPDVRFTYFIVCTAQYNHYPVLYSQENLTTIFLPPWDLPYGPSRPAAVSPDGRYLALGPRHSASHPKFPVIDTTTWTLVDTDSEQMFETIGGEAFSLDGGKFVIVSEGGGIVIQYDVGATFTNRQDFSVDLLGMETVYRAEFVPAGLMVFGSGYESPPVIILDPTTYEVAVPFPTPVASSLSLVAADVSADKNHALIAMEDSSSNEGLVAILDSSTLMPIAGMTARVIFNVRDAKFSDDGQWIAIACNREDGADPVILVVDWASNTVISTILVPSEAGGVAFSDDKTSVFAALFDRPVLRQYDIASGSEISTSAGDDPPEGDVNSFGLHKVKLANNPIAPDPEPEPDPIYLYAVANWIGETQNQLAIFDGTTNELVSMTGLIVSCDSIAVHPDGTHVAFFSATSPYVRVYECATWTQVTLTGISISGKAIQGEVKFSPDGQYLALATTSGIKIVETSTWTQITSVGGTSAFYALEFSPDSSMLCAASLSSPRLFVFDTSDWSQVAGTPSRSANAYNIAFHPDGSHFIYSQVSNTALRHEAGPPWSSDPLASSSNFGGQYTAYTFDAATVINARQDSTNQIRKYDPVSLAMTDQISIPNPNAFRLVPHPSLRKMALGLNTSSSGEGLLILDTDTMVLSAVGGASVYGGLCRAIAYGKWNP